MDGSRPSLAVHWMGGCGGCEVSLLEMGDRLLHLLRIFEIVYFPMVMDAKLANLRARVDGSIDVVLVSGVVRTGEDVAMAHLLRAKARTLVAFGACAADGGIPALANFGSADDLLGTVFNGAQAGAGGSVGPPRPAGAPLLPVALTLDRIVHVDAQLPGCPPDAPVLWDGLQVLAGAAANGGEALAAGAVLGVKATQLCEECPLVRSGERHGSICRPHLAVPGGEHCLTEEGFVCVGGATRAGCGAACPRVGMGCRGCYGPAPGVEDQGARMIGALAALMVFEADRARDPDLRRRVDDEAAAIVDPAGTFYRFTMGRALLPPRTRRAPKEGADEPSHID